ncbi:MAG: hypothetical protein HOP07_01345 [Bacteriovoracaceae bacterium]|nr:hypothetical protein [Bacteriovoracaceae bacterium]
MIFNQGTSKGYKRTITVLFSLIFFLITIELGMRFTGTMILFTQDSRNNILLDDKNLIRILTVGESTTADIFSGSMLSWPRQLEKLLNSNGKKFRVYNVGLTATTTGQILARLPDQLEFYKPHIVITMMGINDPSTYWLSPADSNLIQNLRLFKLAKTTYKNFLKLLKNQPTFINGYYDLEGYENIVKQLELQEFSQVRPQIEKKIRGLSSIERGKILFFLGNKISHGVEVISKRTANSRLLLRWSLEEYFLIKNALASYIYTARFENIQDCFPLTKKFLDLGGELDDILLSNLEYCVENAASSEKSRWMNLLKNNPLELQIKPVISIVQQTRENYLMAHALLKKNSIKHIAMEYPLTSIAGLKAFFSADGKIKKEYDDIIFAENIDNFQSLLKIHPYEYLFTDRFADYFGHTTDVGHSLIAQSAQKATMVLVKNLNSSNSF